MLCVICYAPYRLFIRGPAMWVCNRHYALYVTAVLIVINSTSCATPYWCTFYVLEIMLMTLSDFSRLTEMSLDFRFSIYTSTSAVAERPRCRVCQFWRNISGSPLASSVIAEHRTGCTRSLSRRCLWLMRSFSVTFANITISYILLKLDSFRYFFVADSVGLSSTAYRRNRLADL